MSQQSEMVIIIRPSFKKVCGPDACRAGVYNHILYRLAKKAKNEPEKDVREGNIFWFASAEDICQDIDEAWCVNKVRKEVKKLVDSGLLGQRHNPIKKWDRKYQYFLSEEQGKKLLERCEAEGVCLLHIGLNAEVLHLLHMVNAFNKNGGCICQKEEMELPNMGNASTINGGAIPEGSQPKGSTKGSLSEERESPPNILDTHTIVSSDTTHAFASSGEIDEAMIREVIAQSSLSSEGEITEEFIQNTIDAFKQRVLVELRVRPGLSQDEIPVTFADCLSYLQEQGVAPQGEDAVEVMVQARTLYAHKHPLQDDQLFTNDAPQGDTHATRVPTVPRADHPASLERHASGHPQSADHCAVGRHNDLPVVHPVGSGTSRPEDRAGRAQDGSVDKKDPTQTLTETPPTSTPAQSLPLPQAEQAALGTRARTRKAATAPDKPEFLPEGEALYRDWCSLFHVTIPKTKAIILAANELYEPITFWAEQKLGITKAEVLKRIMNWLYKNNPNYYGEGRGVKLYDIHRDFEEWQSAAERKLAKDALKVVVPPAEDKSRMFNMTPIILESSRKRQGGLRGKAITATH